MIEKVLPFDFLKIVIFTLFIIYYINFDNKAFFHSSYINGCFRGLGIHWCVIVA